MEEIVISVDYFSVTLPLEVDDDNSVQFKVYEMVHKIADYMNVKNFEILKIKYAQNNYHYQFMLGEHIVLRLDGPLNDNYQRTCHLEMKGEGCRDFEARNPDKTWINLILFMAELNCKFKRIDIAIDDFKGEHITLGWLMEKISKRHYTSVFRSTCQLHGTLESGLTIQFGSTDSPIQLVIYDKKMERKKRKKITNKKYWVRYEMRFRNVTADKIACQLCKEFANPNEFTTSSFTTFAFKQLYRIIDFKEDNNYDIKTQNKVRTDKKWLAFLQNVEKGNLPKIEAKASDSANGYIDRIKDYVRFFLVETFMAAGQDKYLFELEIYRFLSEDLTFSKQRFHKLNICLSQLGLKTLDNIGLESLRILFQKFYEEMELPF